MKDFYYILGTSRNARPDDIEAAYQKLARKFYRDGEEQDEFMDTHFREITEAYDVLRDASRRNKYDAAMRRNQTKQLAAFKLKYLNIAVAITFLVITALFAVYVIRAVHGREAKKPAPKPLVQSPPPAEIIHPKKHRQSAAPVHKRPLPKADTARPTQVQIPPAATPAPVADSTYSATIHANITGIVYLHQSASYNSPVIAKIPDATRVRVLQQGTDYDKIKYDEQEGYVLKSTIIKQ